MPGRLAKLGKFEAVHGPYPIRLGTSETPRSLRPVASHRHRSSTQQCWTRPSGRCNVRAAGGALMPLIFAPRPGSYSLPFFAWGCCIRPKTRHGVSRRTSRCPWTGGLCFPDAWSGQYRISGSWTGLFTCSCAPVRRSFPLCLGAALRLTSVGDTHALRDHGRCLPSRMTQGRGDRGDRHGVDWHRAQSVTINQRQPDMLHETAARSEEARE